MLPCQQCARYIEGILSRTRKAMLQHVLCQYTLQRGCGGKTRKKKEDRLDVGGRKGCRLSLPHFHFDYLPLKFTVSLAAVLRTVHPATQG